jgi:hypothetical protein
MRVELPSHEQPAQVNELAHRENLRFVPSLMSIGGDHVVMIQHDRRNNVYLFNWKKQEFVSLPKVSNQ